MLYIKYELIVPKILVSFSDDVYVEVELQSSLDIVQTAP